MRSRDQPGDPAGQHPGLARARPGDHQQRRAGMGHGLPLRLVEPLEQLVGRRTSALGDDLGLVGAEEGIFVGHSGHLGYGKRAAHLDAHPTFRAADRISDRRRLKWCLSFRLCQVPPQVQPMSAKAVVTTSPG